jgi:hypothetical protein
MIETTLCDCHYVTFKSVADIYSKIEEIAKHAGSYPTHLYVPCMRRFIKEMAQEYPSLREFYNQLVWVDKSMGLYVIEVPTLGEYMIYKQKVPHVTTRRIDWS